MKKNAVVAQSGGPSPVINASLLGVIEGCREFPEANPVRNHVSRCSVPSTAMPRAIAPVNIVPISIALILYNSL